MKLTKTQKAIIEMLTQNTGSHILDSGGAYGRHWQRNQTRSLFDEPAVCAVVGIKDFYLKVSLAHWLDYNLEFDGKTSRSFYSFVAKQDPFESYDSILDAYIDKKKWTLLSSGYTYNYENAFDQDFIWSTIEDADGDLHIVVRSHNGCDARAGFSSPFFFTSKTDDGINTTPTLSIYCNGCDTIWDSHDSGYRYECVKFNGVFDNFCQFDFRDNDVTVLAIDEDEWQAYRKAYPVDIIAREQLSFIEDPARIIIKQLPSELLFGYDDKSNLYCPICGSRLELDAEMW